MTKKNYIRLAEVMGIISAHRDQLQSFSWNEFYNILIADNINFDIGKFKSAMYKAAMKYEVAAFKENVDRFISESKEDFTRKIEDYARGKMLDTMTITINGSKYKLVFDNEEEDGDI